MTVLGGWFNPLTCRRYYLLHGKRYVASDNLNTREGRFRCSPHPRGRTTYHIRCFLRRVPMDQTTKSRILRHARDIHGPGSAVTRESGENHEGSGERVKLVSSRTETLAHSMHRLNIHDPIHQLVITVAGNKNCSCI